MTYTRGLISAALVIASAMPVQAGPASADTAAVQSVLARYNAAVEELDDRHRHVVRA